MLRRRFEIAFSQLNRARPIGVNIRTLAFFYICKNASAPNWARLFQHLFTFPENVELLGEKVGRGWGGGERTPMVFGKQLA